MKKAIVFLSCFWLIGGAAPRVDVSPVADSVFGLHLHDGPAKEYVIWNECGKTLKGDKAEKRADEYADLIVRSIEDVYEKYGELVDPDHVVAVLYRESSHNECVVGRKELKRMAEQNGGTVAKKNLVRTLKKWRSVNMRAYKECGKRKRSVDLDCLDRQMAKTNPEFKGIYAWDVGAAQFRWPGSRTKGRSLKLPDGRTITKVGIDDLLDAEVSIQMLVEDLALYKRACRHHTHWLTKRGRRVRKLDVEEAYFVHHHTGENAWDSDYWRRVNRHLVDIKERRAKEAPLLAGRNLFFL